MASRSDKNGYRQQEVLQEKVSAMIRDTLDEERFFPMIRGTPDDKRYSR